MTDLFEFGREELECSMLARQLGYDAAYLAGRRGGRVGVRGGKFRKLGSRQNGNRGYAVIGGLVGCHQ